MITNIATQAKTALLMSLKFLMMCCGFVHRDDVPSVGMNGECDQVTRGEALELEEFSWSELPADIVQSIIAKMGYESMAKLACACTNWKDIVQSIPPFYPVGKTPLLIHLRGAYIHFYCPLLDKDFQVSSPLNWRKYDIISAIGKNLLICKQDDMRVVFRMYDPLSSKRTCDFPPITSRISFNGSAIGLFEYMNIYLGLFGPPPYVIFLIDTSHVNHVTVHLYRHPGDWVLNLVYDNGDEPFHLTSNPVYVGGRFYCLGSKGDRLGVFDLVERTWNLYSVKFTNKYHDDDDIRCFYLVDWINTVMMVVQVNNYGRGIHSFLLDRKKMVWKEIDDLCGRSLFLGSTISAMSLPTAKKLQNRVFLPHEHQDEPKRVIVAEPVFDGDQFYFTSPPSSMENDDAATTICCCNKNGADSLFQNYRTTWYQPF